MSDLVRSSVLTGYRALVTRLGGNPLELLHRFKIDPEALERQDTPISFRAVIRLLEASALTLSCADFGLRMACEQDLRILGPVAIIGLNSPTVGDALKAMIEHIAFYCPLVVTTIDAVDSQRVMLTYDIAIDGEPHKRQVIELAIGLYMRHMQTLSGGNFAPVSVWLRHTSPVAQSVYRAHFGTRAKFGQPLNALIARPADLRHPINNADPHLRQVIEDYVKQSMSSHPLDIQRQVAYLVRRLLPDGGCGLGKVAQHLYLHERTLQRRLSQAGLAFEDIVDGVRRERAEELLSESLLPMAHIAEQLGYTKQSSFNRACQRWFGNAPRRVKATPNRLPASLEYTP